MKAEAHGLLNLGSTLNDLDDRMPKSRGGCFDVGIWGGCGLGCPVFLDGDCGEPQELKQDAIEEFDKEDIEELAEHYDCFKDV